MTCWKFIGLLIFQIILAPLYFVFVIFETDTKYLTSDMTHRYLEAEDTNVMIFFGFAFLMSFLKKYRYSALGFNCLLGALVWQLTVLVRGAITHLTDQGILLERQLLVEADMMCVAVLVTFGALVGRASVNQLLFIAIVETFIGTGNAYVMDTVFRAVDPGGAIKIHAFGAFFGIGISSAWLWRYPAPGVKEYPVHPLECGDYVSSVTGMIGTLFLYVYWPSYNSVMGETEADRHGAISNTYFALAACVVTTFVLSTFLNHGKFGMEHIHKATLAGGVSMGSIAHFRINPGIAMMVGVSSAFLSTFEFSMFKPCLSQYCGVMDTCGVLHLHGFPGIYSGILSAYFCGRNTRFIGLPMDFGRRAAKMPRPPKIQAGFQIIAVLVTVIGAYFIGMIIGFLSKIKIFGPIPTEDQYDDKLFWHLP